MAKTADSAKRIKRTAREIILPNKVIKQIKSTAKNEREAAAGLQIAHAIYSRAIFQKWDLTAWFDVPYQTLRGVEYRYFKYLYTLKNVIEFNGSWQAKKGEGQCQKARFIVGGYHIADFEAVPIATKPQPITSDLEAAAIAVYRRLSLKIGSDILTPKTPFFRASLILSKFLTATFTDQYFKESGKHLKPINDTEALQIGEWCFNKDVKSWCVSKRFRTIKGNEIAETMTGVKYKEHCQYHKIEPLRYKKTYVLGVTKQKQFIDAKLNDIQRSAFFTLNAIRNGEYTPHRNDVNRRLDSAFTALPNILSKHVLLDGQPLLCQDLANSQFVILARLILNSFEGKRKFADVDTTDFVKTVQGFKMSDDVKQYCKTAANGTIYDDFAKMNELSRHEAKEAFMFIAFSKPTNQHRFKKVFAKTYPSVFAIIQKFKTDNGHEQLPILLQRIESSIFIDHVLSDCLKNGLSVLTKHDSIYFIEKEKGKVMHYVKTHLNKHLISYKLKI